MNIKTLFLKPNSSNYIYTKKNFRIIKIDNFNIN